MRILNRDTDEAIKDVGIYLTKEEVESLINYLQHLLEHPEYHHFHCRAIDEGNTGYKEITGTIYSEDNMHTFDPRSRKLILEDR
ncbi:MAG TPA: hypothetical protein VHP32_12450 [Ignavibacteria bacterium]|nr:hypothetical protein [Ignavibacteria bacterium]